MERFEDGTRTEYDFRGGVRGKYIGAFRNRLKQTVILDDDVAAVFPTSEAINEAARTLIRLRGEMAAKPRRREAG